MKIFIFENLNQVSERYHPEGGLAVIAKDKDQVYQLIASDKCIEVTDDEWQKVWIYDLAGDVEPRIFVFPDAGCC